MSEKPKPPTVVLDDPEDRRGRLKQIGGSQSDRWNNTLANQTMSALWIAHAGPGERDVLFGAAAAGLAGIAPKDEIEGMLAAQMIAAHAAAMECYRRAMLPEQPVHGRQDNLNAANKLQRSFAVTLDALNRHRGKGAQSITVRHVTVNADQAIVGDVTHNGGPGAQTKLEGQSHAITYAPGQTLWGENPIGPAVPVTVDAKR
ncbi:hypothetical protein QA640_22820 [Bradyrhizobium sp. CB82]|uniref:hypothetical protein n=1 Tax=Bradyrhizobium sp. CB82 TaxID=3039159 RepID=UPI0024B1A60C|nr:hypothetical protein [Bradyrhizobium sp. CB82]WFU37328.1 hypothetical protein QA640_22820 [Bradyrhizobium sp. CB82]